MVFETTKDPTHCSGTSSQTMNTSSIPRVHYTNKRLSFTKPVAGHPGSTPGQDDGWVLVEDYTNAKPSSPKHNFSQEEARLLHQVQATNAELARVKHQKYKEVLERRSNEGQVVVNEEALSRRFAIQKAARASFMRKKQSDRRKQPQQNQKSANRSNRSHGQLRRPMQKSQARR